MEKKLAANSPATRPTRRQPKPQPQSAPPPPKQSGPDSSDSEVVLLAVTGMSPAILTETIWGLAHPAKDSGEDPVIPHRVIVLTTATGRREIESALFAPLPQFNSLSAWDALRDTLAAEGHDLNGRLRFGTTPDDIRVFTRTDRATGRTAELDDIRTLPDNEAAANFILEQVRGLVEDPDKTVIGSLAGGRKTMGALFYACFSLLGRDTDRLTHVLVSENFDQMRGFFFPMQPGGPMTHRDGSVHDPKAAEIILADVPFVSLRQLFRRDLGRPAGGFMRLVEACRAGVRERVAESLQLTVERSQPRIQINSEVLDLTPREHLLMLFLAIRAKNGEPPIVSQKEAQTHVELFRKKMRTEACKQNFGDWRGADSLGSEVEDIDLRRAISSLKKKIQALGGDAATLAACLPGRGRCSLDLPAARIALKS